MSGRNPTPPDPFARIADAAEAVLANADRTVLPFPGGTSSGGAGGDGSGADATAAGPPVVRPLTDLGNAERFVERCQERLVFCPSIGWLAWDGRRWLRDGAEEAVAREAQSTVRSIQAEAEAIKGTAADFQVSGKDDAPVMLSDRVRAWGRASESAARLVAIPKLAAASMSVHVSRFDADPMLINLANGTLRVDKSYEGYVVLKPHDPADLITRLSPVSFDPTAEAPLFDRFLDEIQPPTPDGRRDAQVFLRAWFGYALTGDTSEQRMVFLYGKGRNGKGVLVNVVQWVAGDYADQIAVESFLDSGRARAGGQATPDIAALPGVRMLGTSEPRKGATLDEAFVKLFTGGDRIKARHLNKDFFSFVPHAKLTMQGNYRPKITGSDDGIWGRILLVPCLVFIAPERRDPRLFDKLQGEGSGILNRLLDGLRDWLDYGLVLPEAVVEATGAYREDSDPLGRFLSECTRQRVGAKTAAGYLHATFVAWARAAGESEWSVKGLGLAMKERGIASKRSNGSWWIGIELLKSPADFEADIHD